MGLDLGQFKDMGDMKDVWDKMPDKSWTGLIEAVRQVRSEKGDSESLNKTEKKADEALAEGREFPNNPMELVSFLGTNEASNDNER